jgi:hypothetical protein
VADALSRLPMDPESQVICSLQIEDTFDPENILTLIQEEQLKD